MYSIVLIDDEPIIARGLKILIERSGLPCQVVGVAYNGEDGLKIIEQLLPDIVLTDICMPKIDGLKMIQQLQGSEKEYQLIILSGFLEFEYAKKAMAFGVKHYITKPVEEEALYKAIGDSILETEEAKEKNSRMLLLEKSFAENQSNVKNYLLQDFLVLSNENQSFTDAYLPTDFFPTDSIEYVSVLFQFFEEKESTFVECYKDFFSIIMETLSAYQSVTPVLYENHKIAIMIAHSSVISLEILQKDIHSLQENLSVRWSKSIAAGIGQVYQSVADMGTSFANAKYALEFQIIRGSNSVIAFEETLVFQGFQKENIDIEIASLQKHMNQLDEKRVLAKIDIIFEKLSSHPTIRPQDLQLQSLSILLSSVQRLSTTQIQLNDFLGRDIFSLKTISKFRTIDELKNWLKNIIRSIIALQVNKNTPKEKNIIADVSAYIDRNYSKEINLNLLAEEFYVNPYYLSQLFKEKTGESYLNYLTNLRMNKAKYLLEKTNQKIYEISLQVGYSDTSYFGRLFERNTGYKPSEYRKNCNKKKG